MALKSLNELLLPLNNLLTATADSVRSKTGGTEPIPANNIPAEITSYGGEEATKLISRTIPAVKDSIAKSVRSYAFYECADLTTAELSKVENIKERAFMFCTKLTAINAPKATDIGAYAFSKCENLSEVNLPSAQIVREYAFNDCHTIASSEIELPSVVSFEANAFMGSGFVRASFPSLKTSGEYGFYSCPLTTNISMPLLEAVPNNMFKTCSNLKEIVLPNAVSIGNSGFYDNYRLTTADFPKVTAIAQAAFCRAYSLKALILRSPTVCTLAHTNVFQFCYHFTGTTNATYNPEGLWDGYIYVPSSLTAEYAAATNWAAYADRFRALEYYTTDGTTTGALDPSKI